MFDFISDLLIIYLILELVSIAYMLYTSDEINFRINSELKSRGYKKNKASSVLDIITDTDTLLTLIPFRSILFSKRMLKGSKYLNDYIDSKILSGKYIPVNNNISIYNDSEKETKELELDIDDSLFIPRAKVAFEAPEPYKARNNNLLDENIIVEEYGVKDIKAERTHENETPFMVRQDNKHDVKDNRSDNKAKELAEYISNLSLEDLNRLKDVIYRLIDDKTKDNILTKELN